MLPGLPIPLSRFQQQCCHASVFLLGLLLTQNTALAQYRPAYLFQSTQPAEQSELAIRVADEQGRAVPDAQVLMVDSANNIISREITNDDGMVRTKLVNGSLEVTVQKECYLSARQMVTVSRSQTVKIELQANANTSCDPAEAVIIYIDTIPSSVNTELVLYPLQPLPQPRPGFFKRLFSIVHQSKH